MRPRRLELHGFTAFRDPQEVDFSDFDLFVITGPTGAGKTSLLDAMALALYGQVPRMGKQGLGQLVSHGKAEARIMLEFGVDGDVYRVSRRLPRSGSQQGRLERFDGERWIDAVERSGITPVNTGIADLIKLDFESFCKAILLPQGEFARFLKGDPAERRKTLVALLGLGAYERMGALARERIKELRIKGEQTRAILAEQFADATAETLAEAEAVVADAVDSAKLAADTLAAARELDLRRANAAAHMATATGLAERFATLLRDSGNEVDDCVAAEAAYTQASARRAEASAGVGAAADEFAAAETRRAEVLTRTGSREQLVREIDAATQHPVLEERVATGERLLATASEAQSKLALQLEQSKIDDAQAKAAVDTARETEAQASAASERLASERDRMQRDLEAVTAAAAEEEGAKQELADGQRASVDAAAAAAKARAAQVEAGTQLETLQRNHVVAALVADLDAGDPCPVCDRPLDEHPALEPDVEQRLAQARDAAESTAKAAEVAQQAAADGQARMTAATLRLTAAGEALATALGEQRNQAELQAALSGATDAANVAASKLADATGHRELTAARAQATALEVTRTEAELDAATRERQLRHENLQQAVADQESALVLLRGRFGDDIPPDAAEILQAAREELVAAEEGAEAARQAEATARIAFAEAEDGQRNALAILTAIDLRLGQLRTRAEATLDECVRLPSETELRTLPEPGEARDKRASELAAWCSSASEVLTTTAAGFESAATGASAELVQLAISRELPGDDVTTALVSVQTAERDAVSARVRAEESLARLGERVEQRRQLESRIAMDATQIAVLDVLATELKADHFTDFVVQETLDILAVHASGELLRISDQRYSLISEDGDFSVVDHVNADEQRSVKTLSGGETFMASLSLALALSKHVSELAGEGLGARLEAVFIDEGFGSLDPETLEEVIDALERLREDNLLIGVISHVPALAERIRMGLEVRKEGNRSVVLEAS